MWKPPRVRFEGRVVSDSFASTIDIAPTVLSAAGVDQPEDMPGRDLGAWWGADRSEAMQDDVYMEAQALRGLRRGRWKLVHYRSRPYGELYDLEADPDERDNLWAAPAYSEQRHELERHLMDRMIAITPRADAAWNVNNPTV